ncbi:MAG: hypothetical protein ACRCXM_06900 [Beijerinckiaceae bacterium]
MTLYGENEVHRLTLPGGRQLVVRDLGSPYDNVLSIHLLDTDGTVLDVVEAGGLMADGIFRIIAARDDTIHFTFFGNDETYRLRWATKPAWALPLSLPTGFRYRNRLARHYLTVTTLT